MFFSFVPSTKRETTERVEIAKRPAKPKKAKNSKSSKKETTTKSENCK
jgi:hypothetical protein